MRTMYSSGHYKSDRLGFNPKVGFILISIFTHLPWSGSPPPQSR